MVGYTSVGLLASVLAQRPQFLDGSGKTVSMVMAEVDREDLDTVRMLVEDGSIRPVIDKRYRFEDMPEAMAYLGTRRARGKIVLEL